MWSIFIQTLKELFPTAFLKLTPSLHHFLSPSLTPSLTLTLPLSPSLSHYPFPYLLTYPLYLSPIPITPFPPTHSISLPLSLPLPHLPPAGRSEEFFPSFAQFRHQSSIRDESQSQSHSPSHFPSQSQSLFLGSSSSLRPVSAGYNRPRGMIKL